ncbi:nuclear transport factor 2 family protein [Marilutibacter maris]|uniref:Nuclear transport factor 2 family protein n=1 Tax=Marilutibacter maris TaxID=1605891 RepID=A0A2U9T7P0_9GAMM|nr:nuclear transport factor 2 family protein [Lysobacter maris]AWV07247.1 hypothetical protein C9I47_1546 [Lysobacter maris]
MHPRTSTVAWSGLLLVCLLVLSGCAREDPETALRSNLDTLQQALETRDAGALGDTLSAEFIGPDGMDAKAAERMAKGMFLRYRNVGVTVGPVSVGMGDGHATVGFDAVLSGGQGRILPDAARVYSVQSGWRLEGGEWRLTSIRWEPRS